MKIVYVNIRSLVPSTDAVRDALCDHEIDALGVFETCLKPDYYLDFVESVHLEQLWICIKTRRHRVALGVAYRPPNSPMGGLDELASVLRQMYLTLLHSFNLRRGRANQAQ